MRDLSELMLALFQGALAKPAGEYKDWAFGELCRLIPFDSAHWASGARVESKPRVHSMHRHRLSPDFPASWMRHQHEDGLIRHLMDPATRQLNLICLDRSDPGSGFDDAARERKELFFPHLIEGAEQ